MNAQLNAQRPLSVLLGALGGQGGGVLADWLVESARAAGYTAQGTSIPGVAQRTGATTYYFELFPQKNPPQAPVFCLFPSAGAVDLVVALEPTEAVRAMEKGFVTDNTQVVVAPRRIFSTYEKSVAGDGTVPSAQLLEMLQAGAERVITIEDHDGQLNAVVFGAIVGSGVLPISAEEAKSAIRAKGVAVESNLRDFDTGLELQQVQSPPTTEALRFAEPPAKLQKQLGEWPLALQPLLGHALAQLCDYQSASYARDYLRRLAPIRDLDQAHGDGSWQLTREVAKQLAAWMTFEDVIRVAQLKSRPQRIAEIHRDMGVADNQLFKITDFLKPGRPELLGMLPHWLVARLPGGLLGTKPDGGWPIRINSASLSGYLTLRLLASLRPLRPVSALFHEEAQAFTTWLDTVSSTAQQDYALACDVAALAVWSRGYGAVRRRGQARLRQHFQDWSRKLVSNRAALQQEVRDSLHAARHDPDAHCGT